MATCSELAGRPSSIGQPTYQEPVCKSCAINSQRIFYYICNTVHYPQPLLIGGCTECIVGPNPVGLWMMKPLTILSTVLSYLF